MTYLRRADDYRSAPPQRKLVVSTPLLEAIDLLTGGTLCIYDNRTSTGRVLLMTCDD